MKVDLNLENLADLDNGTAGIVINSALRSAIRDTEDRGDDRKARKVTIEVNMVKSGDDHISATVTGGRPQASRRLPRATPANTRSLERRDPIG